MEATSKSICLKAGTVFSLLFTVLMWEPTKVGLATAYFRGDAAESVTAHSHNDYQQQVPLIDALANRFYSVEADIWLHDDAIQISHLGLFFRGGLKELYLDPLQKRVSELGSVYGDGRNFLLWIELKEDKPELRAKLHEMLAGYPMLSRFTNDRTQAGPVTVVLTGIEEAKKGYVDDHALRYATRDTHRFALDDPSADNRWLWYTLKWTKIFKWRGQGPMPEGEREKLRSLVAAMHAKGRKIRFYSTPDNEETWTQSRLAGVDLINTDHLEAMSRFLGSPVVAAASKLSGALPTTVRQ